MLTLKSGSVHSTIECFAFTVYLLPYKRDSFCNAYSRLLRTAGPAEACCSSACSRVSFCFIVGLHTLAQHLSLRLSRKSSQPAPGLFFFSVCGPRWRDLC